jgi:hypothetical protein
MKARATLKVLVVLLAVVAGIVEARAQMSQAAAHAAASSAASATPATGQINAVVGAQTIQSYTTSASQSGYFQGGTGDIGGPAGAALLNCKNNPPTTSPGKEECAALVSVDSTITNTPPLALSRTDPLISAGKLVTTDPGVIAGVIDGTYSDCTTETVTYPAEYDLQTCEDFYTAEKAFCEIGEVVKVDAEHLYRCLETIKAQAHSTCTVGEVIHMTANTRYQCKINQKKVVTSKCLRTLNVTVNGGTGNCSGNVVTTGGHRYHVPTMMTKTGPVYDLGPDTTGVGIEEYTTEAFNITYVYYVIPVCAPASTAITFNASVQWGLGLKITDGIFLAPQTAGAGVLSVDGTTGTVVSNTLDASLLSYVGGGCNGANICSYTFKMVDLDAAATGLTPKNLPFTITFTRPAMTYTYADSWTNGCSTYEARAL